MPTEPVVLWTPQPPAVFPVTHRSRYHQAQNEDPKCDIIYSDKPMIQVSDRWPWTLLDYFRKDSDGAAAKNKECN